jgi:hypothetical protein
MLFMLACGSVVGSDQSIRALRRSLNRWVHVSAYIMCITNQVSNSFRIQDALAFDAKHLAAVRTAELLTNLTESVIIEGYNFTEALEHNIKECLSLGKHTNVIHLTLTSITRYLWAHKEYQPWGQRLSLQCPQCGILNPWETTFSQRIPGYSVGCKNDSCGKEYGTMRVEPHSFIVPKPTDCALLKQYEGAGWMKAPLKLE